MSKKKVMITDYEYKSLKNEEEIFKDNGIEFIKAQGKTEEEVIENAPADVNGLLVQYAKIGEKVFKALPELKVVGRYGIGVDSVDLEAATKYGVSVVNVGDYCLDEVSDHAMALLLSLVRKISLLNNDVKNKNWDFKISKPIYRLKGKTIGLVGFGQIPRVLVKKAKAFGLKVVVADPFLDRKVAADYKVELLELTELLKKSDYISLHVPLNKNTKNLISQKEFKLMKENAFIINTSRGGVIDEKALIEALKNKEIAGAGLDVTNKEPIEKDNPLLNMKNVIITPHVGWYSEESQEELQTKAAQGVLSVLLNKEPEFLVNPEVKNKIK